MKFIEAMAKDLAAMEEADHVAKLVAEAIEVGAAQAENLEYHRRRAIEGAFRLIGAPAPANDAEEGRQNEQPGDVPLRGGKARHVTEQQPARFCVLPVASIGRAVQIRSVIPAVAKQYADEMGDGAAFTPILVYEISDGEGTAPLQVVAGHHRLAAHALLGLDHINCEVRVGTLQEAWVAAAGSNTEHGLPRSNLDKRNAVRKILALCPDWSDNLKAKHCGVSPTFVKTVKDEYNRELGQSTDDVEIRVDSKGRSFKHTPRTKPANTADRGLAGRESPSVGVQLTQEPEPSSRVGAALQSPATAWTMYEISSGAGATGKEAEPTGEAIPAIREDVSAKMAPAALTGRVGSGAAFDGSERVDRPQFRQRAAVADKVQVRFTSGSGDAGEFTFNLKDPDSSPPPSELWALTKLLRLMQDLRARGVERAAVGAISDYVWADAEDDSPDDC